MEQTALRPKPMPGQEPGTGTDSATGTRSGTRFARFGRARRPHAARRRGRRLTTLLFGLLTGTVLVLSGVGLGTVGATVIGMSKLADVQRQAGHPGAPGTATAPAAPSAPAAPPAATSPQSAPALPASPPARATLGLEVLDAAKSGALVVGVHVPGPGHAAGLVRGDVLLTFGGQRVDTAADLVRAVAGAPPGEAALITVRHESGGYQQLSVRPGVVV
ncbi:PDZ domain-containing protein [Streptomyces sp. NPDC006997]|uniref:PDZ domain-containing protein n=1 Tax=Streptomyces sp. NPDC006997 TaxID=3155356 RepID=UPI0033E67479